VPSKRVRRRRSSAQAPSFAALLNRLERVEALCHDLARELTRSRDQTVTVRAMANAIKQDADAVFRALKQ
jgi:hypothetical protein